MTSKRVEIILRLLPAQAIALAAVIKRMTERDLCRDDLRIATPTEQHDAELALALLRTALELAAIASR